MPALSAALPEVKSAILAPTPVKVLSNEIPTNGLVYLPVSINSSAIRLA